MRDAVASNSFGQSVCYCNTPKIEQTRREGTWRLLGLLPLGEPVFDPRFALRLSTLHSHFPRLLRSTELGCGRVGGSGIAAAIRRLPRPPCAEACHEALPSARGETSQMAPVVAVRHVELARGPEAPIRGLASLGLVVRVEHRRVGVGLWRRRWVHVRRVRGRRRAHAVRRVRARCRCHRRMPGRDACGRNAWLCANCGVSKFGAGVGVYAKEAPWCAGACAHVPGAAPCWW